MLSVIRRVTPGYVHKTIADAINSLGSLKIRKFCIDKLIQLKLVASSFDFPLNLGWDSMQTQEDIARRSANVDVAKRKSLLKMRMIFQKHLVKVMPYMHFAINEVLEVERDLTMTLSVHDVVLDISKISGDTLANMGIRRPTSRDFVRGNLSDSLLGEILKSQFIPLRAVDKYVRNLRALCRKHGLGVCPILTWSTRVEDRESSKYTELKITDDNLVIIKDVILTITFALVRNIPSVASNHLDAMANPERFPDYYHNDHNWNEFHPYGSPPPSLDPVIQQANNFSSPEKIFFHMDKVLKVLETLTRRVSYDYHAYELTQPVE